MVKYADTYKKLSVDLNPLKHSVENKGIGC